MARTLTEEEKVAKAEADAAKAAAKAEAEAAKAAAKAEAEAAKAAKGDVSSVVFTYKNGGTREFSASAHGEDFVKVADEFGETNAKFIASRKDNQS